MIFISHTSADKKFVNHLVRDLASWKFDLWYSTWEIKAGESITRKVQDALRKSDCLVVVLSKDSVEAPWVQQEVNSFLFREISSRHGKIVPIMIEECQTSFFLSDRLQIRFHEEGYEKAFLKLVFELLEMSKTGSNISTVDVFRRMNSPIRSLKQYILRRNQIVRDPLQIRSDYVIMKDRRYLKILKNRDVKCRTLLDILLCKPEWNSSDWYDTIYDSSETPTIESVCYSTNSIIEEDMYDSKISSLVVRWRPRKRMRPGRIYHHIFDFYVKKGYVDPTNYWVHRRYCYPTLWTEVDFSCECEIDRIAVARPPYTFELTQPWEFIAYAVRSLDSFSDLRQTNGRVRVGFNSSEAAEGLLVAFLFPGWQQFHQKERQIDTAKNNREFEQSWLVESQFRNEIGWQGINSQ